MKNINPDNFPVYYLSEAAEVIYANISEKLKEKYDCRKIRFILKLENDYYDTINLNIYEGEEQSYSENPIIVEEELLQPYIIKHAAENNLHIETEELIEILNAELIYYKMIGILGEEEID